MTAYGGAPFLPTSVWVLPARPAIGPSLASGWELRSQASVHDSNNTSVTADCTGTKVVTGGGVTSNNGDIHLQNNPVDSNTWSATGNESSVAGVGGNWTVTVWAICVNGP